MKPSTNLSELCRTRTIDKDQPKCQPRTSRWTAKGIKAGHGIKGDYFVMLATMLEGDYQQALSVAMRNDRLGIKGLEVQKRCDFLIGFFKTINGRR